MNSSTVKILAIDDEKDVTRSIRLTIGVQQPDWKVVEASSGSEGLNLFSVERPDLVLLDMRMPDMSGLDVLHELRRFSAVPVIVLTVTSNELDEVRALNAGADEWLVKPFGSLALVARVRAVLRRASGSPFSGRKSFVSGDLRIDWSTRLVTVGSRKVTLTATEFALLEILVRNSGQVVPSETLLGEVWGSYFLDNKDYLKVYVRKLREKIEPGPQAPRYLQTVRGIGYRFVDSPEKENKETAAET